MNDTSGTTGLFLRESWTLSRCVWRLVVTGAVGAGVFLGGCDRGASGQADTAAPAEAVQVSLAEVGQVKLPVYIQASGSLLADESVTISAKVAGRVQKVLVDLGDQVDPGQLLAEISPRDYELAVSEKRFAMNQALAQLGLAKMPEGDVDLTSLPAVKRAASERDNAQARLDRLAKLHEQKLVSDQDYSDAQTTAQVSQSEYEVALLNAQAILAQAMTRQAELATAEQQLGDTRIMSPGGEAESGASDASYFVAQRRVSLGEYVSVGTPLFDLVDDNPIRLRMAVPERFTAKVAHDQPVRVEVQAFVTPFEGRVTRISPQINQANRTFLVEVTVGNDDHRLKPGGFAMGAIRIESDAISTVVPEAAVTTFAGVSRVFDVQEGKSRQHVVKLGERLDGGLVVLTGGLPGDVTQVISPLPGRLGDKAPVTVAAVADAGGK